MDQSTILINMIDYIKEQLDECAEAVREDSLRTDWKDKILEIYKMVAV